MRILSDPDVFLDDELFETLIAFMAMVIEGRHLWDVDPLSAERAADYFGRHAPTRAQAYRQLTEKSVTAGVYRSRGQDNRPTITATAARAMVADLLRPALVILENQESDGLLLRAVFRAFGRVDLIDALERGWLLFRHAGGGGAMFRKTAMEAAREYVEVVRLCGVLDSDRRVPSARTSQHDHAGEISAHGIAIHVLEFREAENYIPPAALSRVMDGGHHSVVAAAVARLTSDQRGVFDMKAGFFDSRKKRIIIRDEQLPLFGTLSAADLQELGRGFGPKVMNCLSGPPPLGIADFADLGPDVQPELERLLAMIDEVL
ncbi:hypothetical protein [Frankia sp. AgKG'84/4]|uniref:hypothetical protein n=1 Tax=Frankia sp. AgKG'84/4 TaxID=573490 RepID=UPI00200E4D0E|nr:hypothetical protein [Frankia sp. AgKG'84/4]MCL9794283.1 hypothetical protein [Frankia sp. AgKG'84/4]